MRFKYLTPDGTPIELTQDENIDGMTKSILETSTSIVWVPEESWMHQIDQKEINKINDMLKSEDSKTRLFAYDIIKSKYSEW